MGSSLGKKPTVSSLFSIFVLLIIGLIISVIFLAEKGLAISSDLVSFYLGALIVRDGKGEFLYDLMTQKEYYDALLGSYANPNFLLPFRNLPLFAFFLLPLSYFPFLTAYKIFTLLTILVLLLITFLSTKTLPKIKSYAFWPLITVLFYPNIQSIYLGQFTLLMTLILLLILDQLKSQKGFRAGLLAGLLFLKPQYLVMVPFLYLLLEEKRQFLKGLVMTAAALMLINLSVSSFNFLLEYPIFLMKTEGPSFGSRYWHMFSFYSFLKLLPLTRGLSPDWLLAINFFIYSLVIFWFKRIYRRAEVELSFASAILLTIVFSVHSLIHDLSITLVAILVMLDLVKRVSKRKRWVLYLTALVLYFIPFIILSGKTWSSPILFFALAVIALS